MKEQQINRQAADRQTDYVLRTVEERGIRFVRLWFTDVQGFLKSVAINPTELDTALSEGMTFDGSAIDGYARIQESDMVARPDPSSFRLLPWHREDTVAAMFCNIETPTGEPFAGDPRYVMTRALRRGQRAGLYVLCQSGAGVLLLPRRRPGTSGA